MYKHFGRQVVIWWYLLEKTTRRQHHFFTMMLLEEPFKHIISLYIGLTRKRSFVLLLNPFHILSLLKLGNIFLLQTPSNMYLEGGPKILRNLVNIRKLRGRGKLYKDKLCQDGLFNHFIFKQLLSQNRIKRWNFLKRKDCKFNNNDFDAIWLI